MIHNMNQYEKLINLLKEIKLHNKYFSYIDEEIDNVNELYHKLPVITKNDILENCNDYVSDTFYIDYDKKMSLNDYLIEVKDLSANHDRIYIGISGKEWILETTTGSTGKPFTVVKSRTEKLIESKVLFEQRKQHLLTANAQNGFMMLQPIDKYIQSVSYRGIDDKNISIIINYMIKCKPKWLLTTTLLLRKIYRYITSQRFEKKIKELNLSFIETTSQTLESGEKKDISEVFGCPIVNQFGCREVWNIAYECPCGKMHVNDKYLMIDLVDDSGRIIDAFHQKGAVIITSLIHKTFPFVKYYLGDYAYFSDEKCLCGNHAPIICFSGGREKDKLIGSNFYGTDICRKVMRYIYFKHPEFALDDIHFKQIDESSIIVEAVLIKDKQQEFEELLVKTINFLIGDNDYRFFFCYVDKIDIINKSLKPEIFENYYA